MLHISSACFFFPLFFPLRRKFLPPPWTSSESPCPLEPPTLQRRKRKRFHSPPLRFDRSAATPPRDRIESNRDCLQPSLEHRGEKRNVSFASKTRPDRCRAIATFYREFLPRSVRFSTECPGRAIEKREKEEDKKETRDSRYSR